MRKIRVLAVGRIRDQRLRALCDEYYERCRRTLRIEEQEVRDPRAAAAAIAPGERVVLLDERGELWRSRALAAHLDRWRRGQGALTFVIGGPDGVDEQLRRRADATFALGRVTLAHRLARLVLAEQLFRAISIIEGTPYHRD